MGHLHINDPLVGPGFIGNPDGAPHFDAILQSDMMEDNVYSPCYVKNKEEWLEEHGGAVDTGAYYRKDEIDALLSKYYRKDEVDAMLTRLLNAYYTKAEIDAFLRELGK